MGDCIIKTVVFILMLFMLSSCKKTESSNISNKDIISYSIGDIDLDGADELIAINDGGERKRLPSGEPYGKFIEIYRDFKLLDGKVVLGEKPDYSFDFTNMKPSKVQLGDVDGDKRADINIIMYKKVKFHNALAKRPFFYNFDSQKLIPLWLGSRLSRPFDDIILDDIDKDGIAELIAIEELENKNRILSVYKWEGFGFNLFIQGSEEFKKINFDNNKYGIKIIADGKEREVKIVNKSILLE
ncbi:hypothetical protein EHV10_00620 [Lachnoanaerobaculum gingivalis]|uniref:VCBS repeat-containing protein n=1 Tax=Lachnoanaerobaculum gingivalis TaxID=2490855 RepID=A0A3P3R0N2_9FIRM|nr:hypothetical protein [Lachnoanaerobaculum gingivalis]RRJ26568.1 hypothetical protein EHV10_00620 [Lachnoanaerobaculum gingivalis]